jgi:hypothetical protein
MGVGWWCGGARFSRRGESLAAERAVLNTFLFFFFFSCRKVVRW